MSKLYKRHKKFTFFLDADNFCKLPFFHNGVWYDECMMEPKDDYWCPTEVDSDTREMSSKQLQQLKMQILHLNSIINSYIHV